MSEVRELAKLSGFDVRLDDRTFENIILDGNIKFDEGGTIGLGYRSDVIFIKGILKAVGVTTVQELNGKSCWVTLETHNGPVIKIEPLHKDGGKPFDIKAWGQGRQA